MDGWLQKRKERKGRRKEGREIERKGGKKGGGEEKEDKFEREWFRGVGSPQHHTAEQSLALSIADA